MKNTALLALIAAVALLSGCAHPISMKPELQIDMIKSAHKSKKVAGYYISAAERAMEVTTPGGGGDKVKYKPYADLENGLKAVLELKYSEVYSLPSPDDAAFLAKNKITYVFVPKLETDSHSDSAFTWPPTLFTVKMDCVALDATGKTIWKRNLKGQGTASFSEFRNDFSLSAKRASANLMAQLRMALDEAPELQ